MTLENDVEATYALAARLLHDAFLDTQSYAQKGVFKPIGEESLGGCGASLIISKKSAEEDEGVDKLLEFPLVPLTSLDEIRTYLQLNHDGAKRIRDGNLISNDWISYPKLRLQERLSEFSDLDAKEDFSEFVTNMMMPVVQGGLRRLGTRTFSSLCYAFWANPVITLNKTIGDSSYVFAHPQHPTRPVNPVGTGSVRVYGNEGPSKQLMLEIAHKAPKEFVIGYARGPDGQERTDWPVTFTEMGYELNKEGGFVHRTYIKTLDPAHILH